MCEARKEKGFDLKESCVDKRDDPPVGGELTDEASRKRYNLTKPSYLARRVARNCLSCFILQKQK
jgi:hypothetical protein